MAIVTSRYTEIGRSSSPSSERMIMRPLQGRALAKGDGSDFGGAPASSDNTVGWLDSNTLRLEQVGSLTIPSRIKRNGRVVSCVIYFAIRGSVSHDGVFPAGGVNVWAVRRAMAANLSGVDWGVYEGANQWSELGIHFGVGPDVDSGILGNLPWSQADHDANPTQSNPTYRALAVRAELQRLLSHDEPLQLAFVAAFTYPTAVGTYDRYMQFAHSSDDTTFPGTWLALQYRNGLEFWAADSSGARNPANMLLAEAEDLPQHAYMGTPPLGATSAEDKVFVRNELDTAQPAVVVVSGRAQAGSVNHSLCVGTGRMRRPRVYNLAGGQATPSATWQLTWTSATTYDIKRKLAGETSFVTTGITSPTGRATTADETIVYNSLNALTILSAASGNHSGTYQAGDVVTFETSADLHTSTFPLSALDDVHLVPHQVGNRSNPDTSVQRGAGPATVQQLYRHDTRTIANASGAPTGVIGNVTDGANTGTHIKVQDTSNGAAVAEYTVGQWGTLATYVAHDQTEGTPPTPTRVEHVQIANVYGLTHATYPGQLGFTTTLSNPSDFDGNSVFVTGVWLGKLEAPAHGFLAIAANVASTTITLDAPLIRSTGTLRFVDTTTGASETRVIDHLSGNSVILTAAPSVNWAVGTEIMFDDDILPECPFYCYAAPAATATAGRRRGFIQTLSFGIT